MNRLCIACETSIPPLDVVCASPNCIELWRGWCIDAVGGGVLIEPPRGVLGGAVITCVDCGSQSRVGLARKTQCPKCYKRGWDARRIAKNGEVRARAPIACQMCGTPFVFTTKNRKYCGADCRRIAASRTWAAYKMKKRTKDRAAKGLPALADVMCRGCGVPVTGRYRTAEYCTMDCRYSCRNKRRREESASYRASAPPKPRRERPMPAVKASAQSARSRPPVAGCATCLHGKQSRAAATGYECIIESRLTCKPETFATLYRHWDSPDD